MSIPQRKLGIPPRGLCDIRTRAGTMDQTAIPYRAYLKIGCLEMEKGRRIRESEAAMRRVKNVDVRFREIAAQKAALLKALHLQGPESGKSIESPGRAAQPAPQKNQKTRDGFKLRY